MFSDEVPIQVTPRAVEMGKRKIVEAGEPDVVGMRGGIKGGGCSGLQYQFELAKGVRQGRDLVTDHDGLTLLVDRKSLQFLAGATLDWNDGLVGYGFRWVNPNAAKDCGCGTSFQA